MTKAVLLNSDESSYAPYRKWATIVSEALSAIRVERINWGVTSKNKYTWAYLPGSGGYYDQDVFIMSIWECVKANFINLESDKDFQEYLKRKYGAKG